MGIIEWIIIVAQCRPSHYLVATHLPFESHNLGLCPAAVNVEDDASRVCYGVGAAAI
jgi:hypothetical protein